MESQVLKIIHQIRAEKIAARHLPIYALRMEVMKAFAGTTQQMDAQLDELMRIYTIVDHRTINDTAYEIIEL